MAIKVLVNLVGFCAFAIAIVDFSRGAWHSRGGWEAIAVYCGCAVVSALISAIRKAEDRKRAAVWRDYEVAIVRDGILAARQALEGSAPPG